MIPAEIIFHDCYLRSDDFMDMFTVVKIGFKLRRLKHGYWNLLYIYLHIKEK